MGGDRLALDKLTIDKAKSTIEVTGYVDVDLYFPLFGLSDERRVTNVSAAVYSDKKVEIAMMLDVTGSMAKTRTTDKIGDLIDAAENAVTAMLANQDPKNPRIRVALVPYASGVNVGGLADNVYAEQSGKSNLPPLADDPIIGGKKGKALPAFSDYVSAVKSAFPHDDNCATERKDKDGNPDFTDDGPDAVRVNNKGKEYYALVNRDNNLSGSGMNKCPDAKIVPLTADSAALLKSIGEFKASGYTAGAIAVQWTYYMLSPKWRQAIKTADLGNGPVDRDARKVSKVAILMTDGQFNTAFAGVGSNFNGQDSTTRQNAEAICKNMKDDGIEVYTIGFDLDDKDMSKEQRQAGKGRAQELRVGGHGEGQALFRGVDRRRTERRLPGNHQQHREGRAHPVAALKKARAASLRGGPVLSSVARLVAVACVLPAALHAAVRKAASRKDNPPEPRSGNRNHSTSDHLLSFC